jgi:hypothetical protein
LLIHFRSKHEYVTFTLVQQVLIFTFLILKGLTYLNIDSRTSVGVAFYTSYNLQLVTVCFHAFTNSKKIKNHFSFIPKWKATLALVLEHSKSVINSNPNFLSSQYIVCLV